MIMEQVRLLIILHQRVSDISDLNYSLCKLRNNSKLHLRTKPQSTCVIAAQDMCVTNLQQWPAAHQGGEVR